MTLLFTLLTLAVLGVIAAVAIGAITGGLEDPSTTLPSRGLPAGPVAPEAVKVVRFSQALRGYRMEEVDIVLDRLGEELAQRDQEILQLSQELRLAERTYLRQAARAAANPEWAPPGTGSLPVSGPGTGALPAVGADAEPAPFETASQSTGALRGSPYPAGSVGADPYLPYAARPARSGDGYAVPGDEGSGSDPGLGAGER